MEFRKLTAEDVECRISQTNQYGVGLLLYKDARCDQNILDETVGAMNWRKDYQLIDGQLFCTISIWDAEKGQWISKQDVGTESNTEAEKGRASDAQKRAAFVWGIGRELYTAPDMWVKPADLKKLEKNERDKWVCKDKFIVTELEYNGDTICKVVIKNVSNDRLLTFGQPAQAEQAQKEIANSTITAAKATALKAMLEGKNVNIDKLLEQYKVKSLEELTETQHMDIFKRMEKV